MLIVKFIKYQNNDNAPSSTVHEHLREAITIHVIPKNGKRVIQLGDAPDETFEATVGEDPDCSYSVAFVMNMYGKTVEIIR